MADSMSQSCRFKIHVFKETASNTDVDIYRMVLRMRTTFIMNFCLASATICPDIEKSVSCSNFVFVSCSLFHLVG